MMSEELRSFMKAREGKIAESLALGNGRWLRIAGSVLDGIWASERGRQGLDALRAALIASFEEDKDLRKGFSWIIARRVKRLR